MPLFDSEHLSKCHLLIAKCHPFAFGGICDIIAKNKEISMEQLPLTNIDSDLIKSADYSVTKANTLVEANYRLSLTQQRIVILMASLVQPDDEDFKWYRLSVGGFMDILDINRPNLYTQMVFMIHKLMEVVLTIHIGEGKHMKTHWIQKAKYEVGGGFVDVSFDPDLKPFLLHLKGKFTTYKLENVMQLKSSYSIRIYELMKQYQNIGKRVLAIEALKTMLGIEAGEYQRYNHFKEKVILVAYREINEKTDINFDFKEIKLSRKVNELEFTITKKTPPAPPDKATLKKEKERKHQEREYKKKEKQREKVDRYLAQLSADDMKALREEAEGQARHDGGTAFRERSISETMINAYVHTIVTKRLKI
jgi:plasmid replication initiation protein